MHRSAAASDPRELEANIAEIHVQVIHVPTCESDVARGCLRLVVHGVVAVRGVQDSHSLASASGSTTRLNELQVLVAIPALQAVLDCREESNVDAGQRSRVTRVQDLSTSVSAPIYKMYALTTV